MPLPTQQLPSAGLQVLPLFRYVNNIQFTSNNTDYPMGCNNKSTLGLKRQQEHLLLL